ARKWAFLGLALGEPLRRSAVHHFRWAREQAERDPEGWSPVLRSSGPMLSDLITFRYGAFAGRGLGEGRSVAGIGPRCRLGRGVRGGALCTSSGVARPRPRRRGSG